ncbi:YicC/YloC family endoribonuclease [Desulforhopalus singaporensis]|uniref:TIGR00255 family protein n=1 Tax=Desulforhopalus singaporensis TaxID=91360 RepID=A0A1H0TIJ4_9BACT|nr:YicC/YloC family endoribonuclease [Desulforhopalus singaporensis]SDP53408.1 TIGR00255 family protein [Desulforhopalus singaporensis]
MALTSMTGFGRGELESQGRVWSAEVRSVNNRYLDLKMKLPKSYGPLEDRIRKKVAVRYLRGRVDLYLSVAGDFSELQQVKINMTLARGYENALSELAKEFQLPGDLTVRDLASLPEVIVRDQQQEDLEEIWPLVENVVDEALGKCDLMRQQEGAALGDDLLQRLRRFSEVVTVIEGRIPEIVQQRKTVLEERLQKLLGGVQLDPARLAQEVAVMADKSDVTEEIVRLRCHIEQFTQFLGESGGVGRKLDFLIQEFLREVNTLASKISDAAIAHLAVDLKSELEKMREQVQNIE